MRSRAVLLAIAGLALHGCSKDSSSKATPGAEAKGSGSKPPGPARIVALPAVAAAVAQPITAFAYVVLKRDGKQVVFAGDSTIPEWHAIRRQRGRSIECLLLTIPHHAGKVWENQPADMSIYG